MVARPGSRTGRGGALARGAARRPPAGLDQPAPMQVCALQAPPNGRADPGRGIHPPPAPARLTGAEAAARLRRACRGGGEGRMGLALRILLTASGAVAAVLVARDAPNFGVVQGMLALVLVVAVLLVAALLRRRR